MSPDESQDLLLLSVPDGLEEAFVAALRAEAARVPEFTLLPAEGVGAGLALTSAMEQVRGRARRRVFLVAVASDVVPGLLAALGAAFPNPDIRWWRLPVTSSGRFGP